MKSFFDQQFNTSNFPEIEKGDFDQCIFENCDFSDFNFSGYKFSESRFVNCNLSLAKLGDTAFRDVEFVECKMLGLHFEDCNDFGFSIDVKHSVLNHSSFYQVDLRKSKFKDVDFQECEFAEANLSKLILVDCRFDHSHFERSILEAADFRSASGFSINPVDNSIKKSKFSRENISGLLDVFDINIE